MAFLCAGSGDLSFCCHSCPAVLSTIALCEHTFRQARKYSIQQMMKRSQMCPSPLCHPAPPSCLVINHTCFLSLCPQSFQSSTWLYFVSDEYGAKIPILFSVSFFFCIVLYLSLFLVQPTPQKSSRRQPVIKHISLYCGDYGQQQHNPLTQFNATNQQENPGRLFFSKSHNPSWSLKH